MTQQTAPASENKKILLGVSGSIAAYKSPDLVRKLRALGFQVKVVMTQSAREFIGEFSLQAVSGNAVRHSLFDVEAEAAMGHIELARWCDAILIAPASAQIISDLAIGSAANLLTTVCLASTSPIFVAPAMNVQMWQAQATQHNINILRSRGVSIVGPDEGDQACGEVGPGRMLEPEILAQHMQLRLQQNPQQSELEQNSKFKILVTAGPTRENIDPVRYLTNYSSGKMGYAIAEAALAFGSQVTLVSGPTNLAPVLGVQNIPVTSSEEMYETVMAQAKIHDIVIAAAAVADYTPASVSDRKIKKDDAPKNATMLLELRKTKDIIANVAQLKEPPFTVAFAAETDQLDKYAKRKLQSKKVNMVAANRVDRDDLGFNVDNNELTLYWQQEKRLLSSKPKKELAKEFVSLVIEHYRDQYKTKNS